MKTIILLIIGILTSGCAITEGISNHNYRLINNPKTSKTTLLWLKTPPRSWATDSYNQEDIQERLNRQYYDINKTEKGYGIIKKHSYKKDVHVPFEAWKFGKYSYKDIREQWKFWVPTKQDADEIVKNLFKPIINYKPFVYYDQKEKSWCVEFNFN